MNGGYLWIPAAAGMTGGLGLERSPCRGLLGVTAAFAGVLPGVIPVFRGFGWSVLHGGVYLGSIPAFRGKIIFRSFPVISGNGVFLRQAQDDRMDVPPLAGVMAAWAASSSEWGLPAQYRNGCAMTAMIAAQVLRTDYGPSRFWADFWTFFRFV